ncbi:MAG TPA: aldolase/citrate lyase family protein [Candidatus Methylomirabilis sp.]|nr:aldolase/citrate lyase family protein [Candidatus Methylomirabilis sp.]HSC71743.1 aldolase/citrate lyase family protein [Candidatus Methylomirabilis sp.]
MNHVSEAGQRGEKVRSDCWVRFEPRTSGGLELGITSKVEAMYGDAVRATCRTVLDTLGVRDAVVSLEDAGAVDFVLAARIEAAVQRAGLGGGATCLPAPGPGSGARTTRERFRRSRLYLPGNEPKYFLGASQHGPDGIILDLEDSVAPPAKDAARLLVRNALRAVDFGECERMVRINQGDRGLADLDAVVPQNVHVILIPKVESAEQVQSIDARAEKVRLAAGLDTPCFLMPIIESALGCFNALAIATASPNVVALTIGLEDYTADLGAQRTPEGRESFWARQVVVNAARAAGVTPIDTVFSDFADMEGLRQACLEAKGLGFEGKGCIHPRQVPVVHEAFAPSSEEVEKAKRVVLAFEDAERRGLGVVALGSKMVDAPVVRRALRTVQMAEALALVPKDWRAQGATTPTRGKGD